MKVRQLGLAVGMCMALGFGSAAGVLAKEAPPETTPEGPVLQKSTKSRIVYLKPCATSTQYNRVAILEPLVEFDKDWQTDYHNSDRCLR